jgi:multidrug efflux pump subunit AcrA (membrane-fusion protein)
METIKPADQPPTSASSETFARRPATTEMKRSHWIIFFVICLILGILVFATVVHMIGTAPATARLVRAPSPVETVPVRRQDLKEVIGGSGSIEQAQTVQLTSQVTAQVLEVPVKIGDIVKKAACSCAGMIA